MKALAKHIQSDFIEVDIDFEILTKKRVRTILPKEMSLYELEQILLYKLNIPNKERKDATLIRINDRLIENYKKQLMKISEVKLKKMRLKANLDQVITNLLEFDYSNIMVDTPNKDCSNENVNDFNLNKSQISLNNYDNIIPILPLNNLKLIVNSERGVTIKSDSCSYNSVNYTLCSFNLKDFFKYGINPKNLISFSELSHKRIIKPIARVVDVELSEHTGIVQYKNILPNLDPLFLNTLERKIYEEEDFPDSNKWEILYQICDILEYFHENNIIHGNLTPFQVITDQIENIFLIDFGISKYWQFEESMNEDKHYLLSRNLLYCPPEFFTNQLQYYTQFRPSSDIWSIGCIIYFMFAKKHPWVASKSDIDHNNIMSYLDEVFKAHEIFYLSDEHEIDPNAYFLIHECCKHNHENRITIKQLKMFIILIANKKCPQLIQKIRENFPKDDIDNQDFSSENLSTMYSEKSYIQTQITKVAEIFSSKVLIQGLLENFENNVDDIKLDFSNERLGNEKINFLGNFFNYLNHVKTIDLRSNSITLEGIDGIISLYNNFRTKLQKLYLDKNPIDNVCFQRFVEVITPSNCYIKILSLVGCSIQVGDIIPLLKILNKFSHLDFLDLSSNFIGDYELTLICQGFKYTKNLKSLILLDNLITGKGFHSFNENTKHLINLKLFTLDISHNKLGPEGFKEFAKIFSCVNHISTINLEGNNATDEGVCTLFNYMADNAVSLKMACQIENFNLSGNEFTDIAGNKIISYLSILKNNCIKNGIVNLNIQHNNLSPNLEKKIMELHNYQHYSTGHIILDENQNVIESMIKFLNQCLTKKCSTITVSHFKIIQKLKIVNGKKLKYNIFINTYKLNDIDTLLYNELRLAENFYEAQRKISNDIKLKLNFSIDFYPHLFMGDKFLPLEKLQKVENKNTYTYTKLDCNCGEITIIVFFLYIPNCISLLKDLNNLLIVMKERWNQPIKVKAILYGSLEELKKLENKESYLDFEFFVLDSTLDEGFTYVKVFFKYDLFDLESYAMGIPPIVIVNKFRTISLIGKIDILHVHDCISALLASNSDYVYSKKRNKLKRRLNTEHIEVSQIDKSVLKKIRYNISFFQKTLHINIKSYNLLFEYCEKRDTIIGKSLDVVGYKATKLRMKIFVRKDEALAIDKFLKCKLNKILPLDVFIIDKNIMKTIDFDLGNECKNCKCGKEKLYSYHGQYFCYWCNQYYCEACGDIFDDSKKGLNKLVHHHNMVYLLNNPCIDENSNMKDIDLFKLGKPNIIEESKNAENIDDLFKVKHFIICDYCEEKFDQNFRYICLSCRPGYIDHNLVDFCPKCFDFFRGKGPERSNGKNAVENDIVSCHDISSHIYLKVIASFGDYSKY